jgi:hypothetical protein
MGVVLYSPEERRIYHKTAHSYQIFAQNTTTQNRSSTSRFTLIGTVKWSLPSDSLFATITCLPLQRIQLTSTSPLPPPTPLLTPGDSPPTIHAALQALPPQDRWAVLDNFFPDDGQMVAKRVISGSATAVSDGSFKSQFGISGCVIRGDGRRLEAIGVNAVPGLHDKQSSYRSELAGISGSLAIIYAVCRRHSIQEGSVTLILDGIEAMRCASNTYRPLSPQETNFDLLSNIRAKVAKLPITIHWKWIEGHQENFVSFSKLSPLSQDNVWADRLAKPCMTKCLSIDYKCPPQRFGNDGWSLSFRGYKLSKVDFNRPYAKMWSERGITYWSRKHKISKQQACTIDWDVCGRAIDSLNFQE